MTVSRPAGLQAGVEIRLGGHGGAVTAVTGTSVQLSDVTGQIAEMPLAAVLAGNRDHAGLGQEGRHDV